MKGNSAAKRRFKGLKKWRGDPSKVLCMIEADGRQAM
jgi:hypothetical protein